MSRVVFRIRVTQLTTFDGMKLPKGGKHAAGTRLPTDTTRGAGR